MFRKIIHGIIYKLMTPTFGYSNTAPLSIKVADKDVRFRDEVAHALVGFQWYEAGARRADIILTDSRMTFIWNWLLGRPAYLIDRYLFRGSDATRLRDLKWALLNQSQRQKLRLKYSKRFKDLQSSSNGASYIIAPGPSIETVTGSKEIDDIKNGNVIICNSVVKAKHLLQEIQRVDVMCFSDPVFHFSSSEYCKQFIKDLIDLIEEYDPFLIVPISAAPLTEGLLGAYSDKIIGLSPSRGFNIPDAGNMTVEYSGNILTSLMLPVAAALNTEIHTIGCDGREKNETYFWKHNDNAQYTELMETVFEKHPSFLRDQDLDKYYQAHIKRLERDVAYLRSQDIKVQALTKTFIDILK